MYDREKEAVVELGSSGAAYNGKGIAKRHIDKSSKKRSKKGKW